MSRPDLMFIGTYTRNEPHVEGKAKGIHTFQVDAESGALTPLAVTDGLENPSYLTLAPAGNCLYAVSEVGDFAGEHGGGVAAYSIEGGEGTLSLLNQQPSHGVAPCYASVDVSGRYLLVANYGSGVVAMYPLNDDGSLQPASCVIQHEGSSVNPRRQEGPHAHSITIDPANSYALAADLGMDQVLIYRLDLENGQLLPGDQPWIEVEPGMGPRHFAFHPNREYGYLIQEIGSAVTVFAYDENQGTLATVQTLSTLPEDFDGNSACADIHVHPSGRFVYGSNRGHDSIAIFAVDEENGTLTSIGHESTRGRTPRNFAIDPAGRFLFAANQDTDTVVTFAIDPESGLLSYQESFEVPSPVCIKILPKD